MNRTRTALLLGLSFACADSQEGTQPPRCEANEAEAPPPYYFHASCRPKAYGLPYRLVPFYIFKLDWDLPASIEWEIHSPSLDAPEHHAWDVQPDLYDDTIYPDPTYNSFRAGTDFRCETDSLRTDSHILAWAVMEDGSAVCFAFGAGARAVAEANDCVGFYDHAEEQGGGTALMAPPPRPD